MMLESGERITGLVMASRLGDAIAAELGTMQFTEQVDAFESMGL